MNISYTNINFGPVYGSYKNATSSYYDSNDKSFNFYGFPGNIPTPYNFNLINGKIYRAMIYPNAGNLSSYNLYFLRFFGGAKAFLYDSFANAYADTNKIDAGVFTSLTFNFVTTVWGKFIAKFYAEAEQCCPPVPEPAIDFYPNKVTISYQNNEYECMLGNQPTTQQQFQFLDMDVNSIVFYGMIDPNDNTSGISVVVKPNVQNGTTTIKINLYPLGNYFSKTESNQSFPLNGTANSIYGSNSAGYEFSGAIKPPQSIHLVMPSAKFYVVKGPTIELGDIDNTLVYDPDSGCYVTGAINYYNISGRLTLNPGIMYPSVNSLYSFLQYGAFYNTKGQIQSGIFNPEPLPVTIKVDENSNLYWDSGNLQTGQILKIEYSFSRSATHADPYFYLNPSDPFYKSDYFYIMSDNPNAYYSTIR